MRNYKILEAKIEYKHGKLDRITVLVHMGHSNMPPLYDTRAIQAASHPTYGYMWLTPDAKLSEELLQKVAAQGCEMQDRDKLFPKWKTKYKDQ